MITKFTLGVIERRTVQRDDSLQGGGLARGGGGRGSAEFGSN
jgi:hypothetical protein